MPFVDYSKEEIQNKIVYCGADFAGRKSNLECVYKSVANNNKEMKRFLVQTETGTDEIVYFNVLALEVGTTHKFKNRFHFYTLSKNSLNPISNRLLLEGVDGIIFVVNSECGQMDANLQTFHQLKENLGSLGTDLNDISLVLQFNKRDLPNIYSLEELKSLFVFNNSPYCEAIASKGIGIDETLRSLALKILVSRKQHFRASTLHCL